MTRNPALDGSRALAVVLVILHHAKIPWFTGGFIGVDIFFVLSGYLITGILLREADSSGDIAIGRFLVRRALRLMPPFLMLLTAVLMIGPFFWPDEDLGLVVVIAGLYLSDYVNALFRELSVLEHTWSLSVEEHFYLIWPLAVIGLARIAPLARRRVLLVAFLAATLWRLGNAIYFPDYGTTAFRFDTRLSGLLIGAWLSVSGLYLNRSAASAIGLISLAGLAILAATSKTNAMLTALLQPAVDIAAVGLIAALAAEKSSVGRAFSWWPFVWLGLISYTVYLWHFPISLIARSYTDDWLVVVLVTLSTSVAIAALSFYYVERPLQSWRQRRFALD